MTVSFLLIQAIGFVAFMVSMLSYQFKNQRTFFKTRICSDGIWAVHYVLLGAIAPATSIVIAMTRTYFAVFAFPRFKGLIVIIAVLAIAVSCHYFGEGRGQDYLPLIGAVVYALAIYFNESYLISRCLMGLGLLCWLLIGVAFTSYPEVISSAVGIGSLLLGFYRHAKSDERIDQNT